MKTLPILLCASLLSAITLSARAQTWQAGLTAYYPLNGLGHDASGNGRDATVHGAVPTTNRFGAEARALDFNGISAHLECPPAAYFGPEFSISAWVNARSKRFWARVMDFGNGQDADNVFLATSQGLDGVPLLGVYQGPYICLSGGWPSALPLNAWKHIAVSRNGVVAKLFLDGELVATVSGGECSNDATTSKNYLGRSNFYADSYFDGILDDVRIWNRALSAEEIAEVFASDQYCAPRRAKAAAQVVDGFLVGATITDAGCGYTNPPVVLVQDGGGAGATATAIVSDGRVVAVNITDAGCCYTNAPRISIASPPFMPTVSIAASKVRVTQHVVLGRNYLLQSSFDLVNWTPAGPPFTATDETIVNEFDVEQEGRHFRIQELP